MQATDAKLLDRIAGHFAESARLKSEAARVLGEPIAQAGQLLARSLKGGGKVLACGNGGSAADAQHFAPELVNRFQTDRPPLAAGGVSPLKSLPTPDALISTLVS